MTTSLGFRSRRATALPFLGRCLIAISIFACVEFNDADKDSSAVALPTDSGQVAFDPNDISAPSYESFALDTAGVGQRFERFAPYDTSFKRINPQTTAATIRRFPAPIPLQGPTALHLQVLLDRANFSPGILDGAWGDNAAKALRWFKVAAGMDSTAAGNADSSTVVDQATYQRLVAAAGAAPITTRYTVTESDIQGPFVQIPERVYDQAKLPCMCYSSPAEALAERFHATEKLLGQLNPGVNLASLAPGATLTVPNVGGDATAANATSSPANKTSASSPANRTSASNPGDSLRRTGTTDSAGKPATGRARATNRRVATTPRTDSVLADTGAAPLAASGAAAAPMTGTVAKLVVSKKDFWIHALDASGNVLYHFPSTLGAGYDPSPTGDYSITNIAQDPAFHYQPKLFAEVSDDKPEARLPKGPNSPVGVVWMAISKPHYGIHGTSAPETIGYANSHGCVRLTNWDAKKLSKLVSAGTKVEFQ